MVIVVIFVVYGILPTSSTDAFLGFFWGWGWGDGGGGYKKRFPQLKNLLCAEMEFANTKKESMAGSNFFCASHFNILIHGNIKYV